MTGYWAAMARGWSEAHSPHSSCGQTARRRWWGKTSLNAKGTTAQHHDKSMDTKFLKLTRGGALFLIVTTFHIMTCCI